MRLLVVTPFITPAWRGGGIARATGGLTRCLVELGHQVVALTIRWSQDDSPCETRDGVEIRRFESPGWLRARLFPLARGIRAAFDDAHWREPFDLVHVAGYWNPLAIQLLGEMRRVGVPWVVQPHGTYPTHGARRWVKWIVDRIGARALMAGAAGAVAVSRAEAADLPGASVVIPNGVTLVGPRQDRCRGGSRRRFLFVGNDSPQKRGLMVAEVLRRLPDSEAVFVGRFGGAFRARMACFGSRARFLGALRDEEMATAYGQADLLVHPARDEAFGLVAFEAALHGTAAVVAGGHGCGEWYREAGGCVVEPASIQALCDAINVRLASPDLRAREALRVADFVGRRFQWPDVARRHAALYADIAGIMTRRGG